MGHEDFVIPYTATFRNRMVARIEHADINDVMLATSLVPDGFVTLYGLTGR